MDALAAKQWEAAAEVNRAVVDQFEGGDTPWARLGLVRDSMQRGEFTTARQGATELLAAHPGYADGHEVLGQLCVELGDIRGALDAYRQASQLTPGCILRRARLLRRRNRRSQRRPRARDRARPAIQALRRPDARAAGGAVVRCWRRQELGGGQPADAFDGGRVRGVAIALLHSSQDADAAATPARALAAQIGDDDFHSEAAVITLLLWARVGGRDQSAGEIEALLKPLALRHCASKAATEVLLAAAASNELIVKVIRRAQAEEAAVAEQCLSLTLSGRVRDAAVELLQHGPEWRNGKLLELAGQVARRRQATIADAAALAAEAGTEMARFASGTTHIAGLRRTGRSLGGLIFRR
jgi:tetratricopeptide (TPR) repeat protein